MEALNTEPIPTPERFLLLLYSTSIAKYLQDYNLCVESINQSFRPLLVVDAVRTQVVRVSTVLEYFRPSVSGRRVEIIENYSNSTGYRAVGVQFDETY